jgi:oligosaccharyltransferase complex subunit gamma
MKFLLTLLTFYVSICCAISTSGLQKAQKKSGSSFIKLTKSNYERVLSGPRDDYLIVLLTATNTEVGCTICQRIQPEFEQLADSWALDHPEGDGLFFARADFAEGHTEIFQKLQLTNVPKLYLYKPTSDNVPFNQGYDVLNIPQNDPFAPNMVQFLAQSLDKHVTLHESINWGSILITGLTALLAVFLIKSQKDLIISVLTNTHIWGGFGVLWILIFTTGYMYNAIRGMPFVMAGAEDRVKYFITGQQQQLGAETQIMSVIYGLLAFTVVFLITKAPSLKDTRVRLGVVLYLIGLNIVLYSVLMSIFKFKSTGYPFHLLNIWSPK